MTTKETTKESAAIMAALEGESGPIQIDMSAVAVLNRSEVEAQLDAAHRYPRSIKKFMNDAKSMVQLTEDIAAACIYTLPRGGKSITGPSVRLAEIAASAYGNLHVASRVLDAEAKEIVAQGVAWDLERNLRVSVEARRRITNKNGDRFNDDMITMTGNAAASIALRNAIFRVVPRAYITVLYDEARLVAVGDAKTLETRRATAFDRFGKLGVTAERVLAKLGKPGIQDVDITDLETLIGIWTAIREGATVEDHFPESQDKPAASNTKDLEEKLKAQAGGKGPAKSKTQDAPAPATTDTKAGEPMGEYDWAAAFAKIKADVEEGWKSAEAGRKTAAAVMMSRFCTEAPPAVSKDARVFWSVLTGNVPLPDVKP